MMKNLFNEIQHLMNRVAGSVDYDEYMKAHPRSKKQPSDPMFKQKTEGSPAAAPKTAPAKSDAPAKTPTTKAKNPLDSLKPEHKKGVEYALKKMKEYGYPDIAKKLQSGKMTLEQAGDFAENWNFHGIAAIFRGDTDTDHALIEHAENRHNSIDLREKESDREHYGNERNHMLDAKYEATNPSKRINAKEDDRDRQRKLNTLTYLHHHGLHDTDTAKRLHKEVAENKDAYNKVWREGVKQHEDNVAREKKDFLDYKPDPKHPDWTKEDALNWYVKNQRAKDKHDEMGKKLGLS
jgi:hypothetical protein